jgi:flagellar export protein FliJ
VLEYRVHLEEQKKMDFARALKILEDEKQKIELLKSDLAKITDNLNLDLKKGNFNVFIMDVTRKYISRLKKEILNQQDIIEKANENCLEKKKIMIEAQQDRKAIEKLEEKEKKQFYKDTLKKEQNILDEIGAKKRVN